MGKAPNFQFWARTIPFRSCYLITKIDMWSILYEELSGRAVRASDFHTGGPRFEPRPGSSALGQSALSSLPSLSEETLSRRTVGQGEPKTGQKQKYRFTKILYFYGLNRKIIILDIMCLNLFEWKIIISTLKITSKSNLWINYIETSKMTIPRFVNF